MSEERENWYEDSFSVASLFRCTHQELSKRAKRTPWRRLPNSKRIENMYLFIMLRRNRIDLLNESERLVSDLRVVVENVWNRIYLEDGGKDLREESS